MRHFSPLPTAALASALLLGCSDQPGVTDPAPPAPSLDAEITQTEQPFLFSIASADPDFTVIIGLSFEELPAFCAGAAPEDLVSTVTVTHSTRDGGTVEHVRITDKELSAIVWPEDVGPEGDACALQGVQPAVGTVQVTLNDNEGQFFETAPGANAFVVRVVGTLTNPETGQRYQLQATIQIVVLPDGTFTFPPVPFFRLTPIGG